MYRKSRERLGREATASGVFSHVFVASPDDIAQEWRTAHANVLTRQRGGGYWIWKPHLAGLIMRERLSHGDVLMYIDSGCIVKAPPTPYLHSASTNGSLSFRLTHRMGAFTKGVLFAAMDMQPGVYAQARQVLATTFALRKDPLNSFLVSEWERLMSDPRLSTDDTVQGYPNEPEFRDHRHDQSDYSLLVYKLAAGAVIEDETWPADYAPLIGAARIKD